MTATTLSSLLKPLCQVPSAIDREITGLALDSREVKPGDLYFAYKGQQHDGREFIKDVIARGAVAIVAEPLTAGEVVSMQGDVPIIPIKNLSQQISQLAASFYHHPADSLCMIGITGTNGKTSGSHFIASALQKLNIKTAVMGTLGNGIYGDIEPSERTTPDAITLQTTLAKFVSQGVEAVAMEVSSHGIDMGRVNGIAFEVGIFTNLTQDHLDYHGDMQTYGAVKKRLFENPSLKHAVINADDDFGQHIIATLHQQKDMYAYSVKQRPCLVPLTYADEVKFTVNGLSAKIHSPWGEGHINLPLIGQFNLSNVLAVLTTLCVLKIPFNAALQAIASLKSVPGRMQTFGGAKQPLIIVDYAHTPDAMEKVLSALRQHCDGQLFCVFGCGGERDRGKRPLMAKIAEEYADRVIVTDDNPRHEPAAQIVEDIMQGFLAPERVMVQHDRSKAIEYIIQCAKEGDCVLIAGKGAETYQVIGDEKVAYSDLEKVSLFLAPL
jgi:UDP-N-acetylmuramoyl-L-alanyl-D-glutamate--2,6-diaminopimelate ligase